MEEEVYRMNLTENFLVLIVIGLWILAVINLAKKLERICNPPSVYTGYSEQNKTSLSPSTLNQHYSNDLLQPTRSSSHFLVRATSEPMIDTSPRTTVIIRSPSETCIHTKSSISEHISSPSVLELGENNSSWNLIHRSNCRIHVETISKKPILPQTLLNPKRIPSIVRRSLLDLHRRALMANASPHTSKPRYIVTTIENLPKVAITNRFPLMKKACQRDYTIDEDEF